MAIVNSRAAIEPKTGKAAIFVNETIPSLMRKLFSNGEQGFFYDPNDLSTMYQDAAGTIPVTAAGQAVGLILDKSKGLVLGLNLPNDPNFNSPTAWRTENATGTSIVDGKLVFNNVASYHNSVSASLTTQLVVGRLYKIQFTISDYVAGSVRVQSVGLLTSPFNTAGIKTVYVFAVATDPIIGFQSTVAGTTLKISELSVKELTGNHAYQSVSAMRPLLVAAPQRLDYDAVDDKLITNLPAQLSGCTVVRSVPNVGTQILTGQTIPATYEDNTDHCGLIVINRSLTPSETSAITSEFNKMAGV